MPEIGDNMGGLARIIASHLSPLRPSTYMPERLDILCLRSAAIYAVTALHKYCDGRADSGTVPTVDKSLWESVFPLLDAHFLRLVPGHHYETFLDHVLCALEVASHYDAAGRGLLQYVVLFLPRHMARFKVKRCYKDKVLVPTILCLHRCVNLEELYLENADSPTISTYLLSHILKFLSGLRVLALPKQADDDVLSVVGMNCKNLVSIVITSTSVSNLGLSWLLCCRKLHTVIIKGTSQGVTPKGVALLMTALMCLRHLVYDVLSDILTYLDFNSPQPRPLKLRTAFFHSMELLGHNHLELVSKLCPMVEWLSLDSALTYNLEGLGRFTNLKFLKLNYKGRPFDQSVVDFFAVNGAQVTSLHFTDVKDITNAQLMATVGQCNALENLVLEDCSLAITPVAAKKEPLLHVEHLQIVSSGFHLHQEVRSRGGSLWNFLSLFQPSIKILDMDVCPLDAEGIQTLLHKFSPNLTTVRCPLWSNVTQSQLKSIVQKLHIRKSGSADLLTTREVIANSDVQILSEKTSTRAAKLLSEYVGVTQILPHTAW